MTLKIFLDNYDVAVLVAGDGESAAEGDMDDDEFENAMSLAAIEAELKPRVVETFDKIANEYKKLRRLQEQDIANQLQSESLSPSQERKYKKLKDEIITVEIPSRKGPVMFADDEYPRHGATLEAMKALAGRMGQLSHGVSEMADFLMLQVINRFEPLLAHYADAGVQGAPPGAEAGGEGAGGAAQPRSRPSARCSSARSRRWAAYLGGSQPRTGGAAAAS